MSTGSDHYRRAEELLNEDRPRATIHALLALAAATALATTTRYVGDDSPEISAWARLVQPGSEPEPVEATVYPAEWPPLPGSVWQDKHGRRWICIGSGCLASIDGTSDDTPSTIWEGHGPLGYVMCVPPAEVGF